MSFFFYIYKGGVYLPPNSMYCQPGMGVGWPQVNVVPQESGLLPGMQTQAINQVSLENLEVVFNCFLKPKDKKLTQNIKNTLVVLESSHGLS